MKPTIDNQKNGNLPLGLAKTECCPKIISFFMANINIYAFITLPNYQQQMKQKKYRFNYSFDVVLLKCIRKSRQK